MAHVGEAGSSRSVDSDKTKGTWKEQSKTSHHVVGPYRLFPEVGQTHRNKTPLLDFFSTDQRQTQMLLKQQENQRGEGLTQYLPKVTQFPFQAMQQTTCLRKREDINGNETGCVNVQIQMSNHEANVPLSACGSSSWFSNAPATVQQASHVTLINHGRSQSSNLPSHHAPRSMECSLNDFIDIMEVQQAYLCALQDPDQITAITLLHQSPHNLKNHYADYISQMPHSRQSPVNAVTQQQLRISSSQMQHSRQENINHSASVQRRSGSPMDTFRITCSKGQIADICANPHGSRHIQLALETATPEEIIMVYEEVIPFARTLTTDVFANFAIQKLLDHGPQFYQMKFIRNFIGHVVPLSHHMYGCRVIQKAFEVAEDGLKVKMAREFSGKVLKCARNQYANHVLQRCMECAPAKHIEFIFRSFCTKAKEFSTTPYGCHIIQKVLAFCNNAEIRHKLVSEIVEAVVKLVSDPFGNYVVQYVVAHGGPVERSMIVNKFSGHVLSMSYQKYASNVIEKCLAFGSFQDRQLITTEILMAGDRQNFDHLRDMMCHMYATFVIQKLVPATDEGQLRVLAEVAHRNMATIMEYAHGRHVIANIQKALIEKGMSWPSEAAAC